MIKKDVIQKEKWRPRTKAPPKSRIELSVLSEHPGVLLFTLTNTIADIIIMLISVMR